VVVQLLPALALVVQLGGIGSTSEEGVAGVERVENLDTVEELLHLPIPLQLLLQVTLPHFDKFHTKQKSVKYLKGKLEDNTLRRAQLLLKSLFDHLSPVSCGVEGGIGSLLVSQGKEKFPVRDTLGTSVDMTALNVYA